MRAALLVALALGCSATEAPEPAPAPSAVTAPDCDAGHASFVRRAATLVWGRHLSGAETAVLTQLADGMGRAELVRAMTRAPEYVDRWRTFMVDLLGMPRLLERSNPLCYGRTVREPDDGQLAAHVRDTAPGTAAGEPFTMDDLIRSSLRLDDLSPVYRAHLFASLWREFRVPDVIGARAHRDSRVNQFLQSYLNRKLDCLLCHNSQFSVTGDADPALDRTWEVPGLFEQALFGSSSGTTPGHLRPFFRRWGVVAGAFYDADYDPEAAMEELAAGQPAWGMDPSCGLFLPDVLQRPDDIDGGGHLGQPVGQEASVWHVEALLAAGFQSLRDGLDVSEDLAVEPAQSFAWLISATLAERVWEEAYGAGLTLPHSFARNQAQRDRLVSLTRTFIDGGYSLREVLVEVATDPWFNQAAPADCGGETPYLGAPLFEPFDDPSKPLSDIRNTVGDAVSRLPARTVLRAASHALGWAEVSEYPFFFQSPDSRLQRGIGAFLKPTDPGFRGTNMQVLLTWEESFGACQPPPDRCAVLPALETGREVTTCSICAADPADVCAWDDRCCDLSWLSACPDDCTEAMFDYGFPDFPSPPRGEGPDYVERLMEAAPGHSLADLAATLKDRLFGTWTLTDEERPVIEALLDASLETPATAEHEAALRRLCGVWLMTPQFQMSGVNVALPAPTPAPVVLPGESFRERCEAIALLLAPGRVTCADTTLTVTP